MPLDLDDIELELANFAFSIYDAMGSGSVDAVELGNLFRACNLNPTNAVIEKYGGTKKKGEKLITYEEYLPIYAQAKVDKDQGVFEDFVECLKLYDKQEDGTMAGGELINILLALGEKLTEDEVNETTKECLDPEDEDGMVFYVPFLARICNKPVPENPNPFA